MTLIIIILFALALAAAIYADIQQAAVDEAIEEAKKAGNMFVSHRKEKPSRIRPGYRKTPTIQP